MLHAVLSLTAVHALTSGDSTATLRLDDGATHEQMLTACATDIQSVCGLDVEDIQAVRELPAGSSQNVIQELRFCLEEHLNAADARVSAECSAELAKGVTAAPGAGQGEGEEAMPDRGEGEEAMPDRGEGEEAMPGRGERMPRLGRLQGPTGEVRHMDEEGGSTEWGMRGGRPDMRKEGFRGMGTVDIFASCSQDIQDACGLQGDAIDTVVKRMRDRMARQEERGAEEDSVDDDGESGDDAGESEDDSADSNDESADSNDSTDDSTDHADGPDSEIVAQLHQCMAEHFMAQDVSVSSECSAALEQMREGRSSFGMMGGGRRPGMDGGMMGDRPHPDGDWEGAWGEGERPDMKAVVKMMQGGKGKAMMQGGKGKGMMGGGEGEGRADMQHMWGEGERPDMKEMMQGGKGKGMMGGKGEGKEHMWGDMEMMSGGAGMQHMWGEGERPDMEQMMNMMQGGGMKEMMQGGKGMMGGERPDMKEMMQGGKGMMGGERPNMEEMMQGGKEMMGGERPNMEEMMQGGKGMMGGERPAMKEMMQGGKGMMGGERPDMKEMMNMMQGGGMKEMMQGRTDGERPDMMVKMMQGGKGKGRFMGGEGEGNPFGAGQGPMMGMFGEAGEWEGEGEHPDMERIMKMMSGGRGQEGEEMRGGMMGLLLGEKEQGEMREREEVESRTDMRVASRDRDAMLETDKKEKTGKKTDKTEKKTEKKTDKNEKTEKKTDKNEKKTEKKGGKGKGGKGKGGKGKGGTKKRMSARFGR